MRMRSRRIALLVLSGGALSLALLGLPRTASAQTPYVPYFGKNQIRYDKFEWHIYKTDHFEIYYYPEVEKHLERVAVVRRERVPAHQRRAEARPRLQGAAHHLQDRERVPGATTSPAARRPKASSRSPSPSATGWCCRSTSRSDQLYQLITHELTHIFEFDIIPRGLDRAQPAAVDGRRAVATT